MLPASDSSRISSRSNPVSAPKIRKKSLPPEACILSEYSNANRGAIGMMAVVHQRRAVMQLSPLHDERDSVEPSRPDHS